MKKWIALAVALTLLAGIGVIGWKVWQRFDATLSRTGCTVRADDGTEIELSPEQSHMSAIIVAASYKAGLSERAAIIALATAYQESGIRNLDYGDRDSLGLFQQRPDPKFDWGTAEEIMDPWYSSLRFYEELVKFPDWETTDINDQAQKVQRSGFPEAYRKHVPNATALAGAARGSRPASVTCTKPEGEPEAEPLLAVVSTVPGVSQTTEGNTIRLTADDTDALWSAAQLAVLTTHVSDISSVQVLDKTWTAGQSDWREAQEPTDGALITLG